MPSPWTNRLLTSLLDEADQAARIITYRNLELRMTTQEERDRAVIARIGGNDIRSALYAQHGATIEADQRFAPMSHARAWGIATRAAVYSSGIEQYQRESR